MANLILPRRFTQQPQGAVEPVAGLGVASLVIPARWHGYTTTGAPGVEVGTQGVLLKTVSTQASRYKAADRIALTPAASIMWVGEFYGIPTEAAALGGLTYANTNSAPYVGIELKRRVGTTNSIFLTSNNTTTFNNIGGAVAQDTTGLFVVVGSVRSGAQFLLVKNITTGEITYDTGSVSGNISYGTAPRLEIGESLNARDPKSGCAALATFDHAISEGFARDLLVHPWQIFRPRKQVLYFDVAAGGIPTLSFPAATSITASSAVPQVTLTF